MSHRGRLNVMTQVLGKPAEKLIGEFMHLDHGDPTSASDAGTSGYTGDVKYHLGARKPSGEINARLTVPSNPSHLEFVNPVAQGMTRAAQERRDQAGAPEQNVDIAFPIIIHGDAAFPGEGIVAETLNLSHLEGYEIGGSVHIISNNQIGYTTKPSQGRSTFYASDVARGFEIPVIHVNADEPEACLAAVRLAFAYRQEFHKDFMIDLIGYRRWGHNEGDEPSFTQPQHVRHHHRSSDRSRASTPSGWSPKVLSPPKQAEEMVQSSIDELQELRAALQKEGEVDSTGRADRPSPAWSA